MLFQLQNYLKPTFNLFDVPEKRMYRNHLNLSSNELNHSALDCLNKEFFSNNQLNSVRCYPYHKDIRNKIADYFHVRREELLIIPGSDFAINLILMSLQHNKRIVLPNPDYFNYKHYALLNDFQVTEINFHLKKMNKSLTDYINKLKNTSPSIVVISNPNGVTGHRINLDDMQTIASCCHSNNHLLLIDEAYSVFGDIDHTAILSKFNNIIIIKTFSKSHGVAGLRFAALFSNKEIAHYLRKTGIENAVSGISIEYFNFLLENDQAIKKIHLHIKLSKQYCLEFLSTEFTNWIIHNTATHFLTINVRNEKIARKLTDYFYDNHVAIKYLGSISDLKNYIRITIAEQSIMNEVMTLFKKFKQEKINH